MNKNRQYCLSISYIAYFYHVFPLHVETFYQLFLNKTGEQIEKLKATIDHFYQLEVFIVSILFSLYKVIGHLGLVAYVIFFHILYLLLYIVHFNLLQAWYIFLVMKNLLSFTANIKFMLLSNSTSIHQLIDILILHFCVIINEVFFLIKAKLLFYLTVVEFHIFADILELFRDLESLKNLVSELKTQITKYTQILEKVNKLLKTLRKLVSHIIIVKSLVSIIDSLNEIVCSLICKLKCICSCSNKIKGIVCCLQEQQAVSSNGNNLLTNLILNLPKALARSATQTIMNIDHSTINKFQQFVDFLKKLLQLIELYDKAVSAKIISIIRQALIVEQIKLVKLYFLINQIRIKYLKILVTGYVLLSTINFYQKINPEISKLIESLKFDACNTREFLSSCCQVEKYAQNISKTIVDCIRKLAEESNKNNIKRIEELESILLHLILNILWMKFYVDLMVLEILIFKMIIYKLIVMSCGSVFIEFIESEITKIKITNVDSAIGILRECHWYLEAFYLIQFENTMVILALSSKLLFSQYIHEYYDLILSNLYWIRKLIFVIECYINHLIVFKYVTTSLNKIFKDIGVQLMLITYISNVIKSINTITRNLTPIRTSMSKLNTINKSLQITTWKQSAQGIRYQIKLVRGYLIEINSDLLDILSNLKHMALLGNKLMWVYCYLYILMFEVYISFLYTNYVYGLGISLKNDCYTGVIISLMGPFNKIIKFILVYLVIMWANICTLINILQNTMKCIFHKVQCLHFLHNSIEDHINEIDKKVLEVECSIEAVVRNMVWCSLKWVINDLKKSEYVYRGGANYKDNVV